MRSTGNLDNILNPGEQSTLFPAITASPLRNSSTSTTPPHSSPEHQTTPDMAAAVAGLPPSLMTSQSSPEGPRAELPRPYKCPLCDKAFHRLEHQTRHIRTHTGEKPHACNFPGCSKRFSRSDELTRHSRIHSNPNSRRGRINHNAAHSAAAVVTGSLPDGHAMANVMGPPSLSWSNPSSNIPSPNVSPPQSYHQYGSGGPSPYASYSTSTNHSPEAASYSSQGPVNMNLLATAASQAAREHELSSVPLPVRRPPLPPFAPQQYSRSQGYYKEPTSGSGHRLPSLAAYHYAQPMSRSQSHEGDDQYLHRMTKRSRPSSPFSTAPPSPTFSGASCSPPSGHTPALTPGQSPRLPPHDVHFDNHLPGIRHLSLQHMQSPLLEPLEPTAEANGGMPAGHPHAPYSRSQNSSSSGLRISDIVNREDGSQRKLPVPTAPGVGTAELQSLPHSRSLSRPESSPMADYMDRS